MSIIGGLAIISVGIWCQMANREHPIAAKLRAIGHREVEASNKAIRDWKDSQK